MRLRADSASGYRFAAIATLASAVAGLTMLAGIVQLRPLQIRSEPLLAVDAIPPASWPQQWLGSFRSAQSLQGAAVAEWTNVILALVMTILVMAGASALIALFAHASARRYETALRAVVGATRRRIRGEQLRKAGENVAIALAAGVSVGLITALVANRMWPHDRLGAIAAEWVLVSLLFAAAVAAFVVRAATGRMARTGWLGDVLAPEARTNPGYGAEDLRTALLHLQFTFTFALLAAALLVWQHSRMTTAAPQAGGSAKYVTRAAFDQRMNAEQRRSVLQMLERSGTPVASPGTLIGVGPSDHVLSNCGPCSVANMMLPMFAVRTQHHVVGAGFFGMGGFPLRYGREFEDADASERHVVVNDTFVALAFRGQHAIGKSIQIGGLRGDWYTVIGVVRDLPISGLISFEPDDKILVNSPIPGREAAIYFYAGERPPASVDVLSDAPVQPKRAGLHAGLPQTLAAVQSNARAPAGWFAGVLTVLAIAAAIVAVLSLGALTLLNVRQGELEIAARRAVGARRRDIIRMVMLSGLATAARGTVAGVVLSVAVARAIQIVLPEMRIFDPAIVVVTAALLLLASLLAALLPARAAARIMPAQIHA